MTIYSPPKKKCWKISVLDQREKIDMAEQEQTVFEKYVDDRGAFLTSCSLEDNPEVVIAIMGENLAMAPHRR